MNEVEKMYKTIFGEFAPNCSLCAKLIDCEIINNTHNCNNFECDYKRLFIAEKQIELIKWFVINNAELETLEITYYLNDCFQISSCTKSSHFETNFENAIAGLINSLWQDLTEEERKQIKEILE